MLRPFGSAGALSASTAALEEYYQTHGREWERYALITARPVAGDLDAGRALLRALRPFVYRRYLDSDTIGTQIGRASCREKGCQYVYIWGVAVSLHKKTKYTQNRHHN